jgi:diacylglycerol kinase (ATP)
LTERDFFVIANPAAGKGRVAAALSSLEAAMRAAGVRHHIAHTERAGHATELAARAAGEGWQSVVAVGGDGTMGEVLNGIVGTGATLGLVPLGTGNDLARTFGIPLNVPGAIDVLLNGRVERIDLGRETHAHFAIVNGIGFAADVMHFCNTQTGLFRGSAAIFEATVRLVATLDPKPMRVILDNEVIEGRFVTTFVMNTRFTGGGMMICPAARTDDGMLDICLIRYITKASFLGTLPKAYSGRHVTHPSVSLHRSRRVRIESERPQRKMYDGNVADQTTPAECECLPGALDLIVPAGAPRGGNVE